MLGVFKQFQALIERETGKKLKCICTDNGGEYCGPFDEYCKHQGIRHKKTPPKAPQLNGLAERMNKIFWQSCGIHFGVRLYSPLHMLLIYILLLLCKVICFL